VADPAIGFKKLSVEEFERGWSGTCLVFTPGAQLAQGAAASSPWLRFVGYLRPYKKILLHLFLATFVIQMLGIVPPLIIQNILDGVLVHQNLGLLHLLILGLVISTAFTQVMSTLRAYLSNYMVRNLDFSMMAQFFKHTMSLPYSFFAKRKTGDILARFSENQTIRAFLTESTVTTLLNLLMVFIYFTILFFYNVKLTMLLIGFVIPIVGLTVLATPRIKEYAREVFAASTDAQSFLMEALGGIETIKGMGSERPVRLKWERKYVKALETQYRSQSFSILVGLASQVLNSATTIVILWAGASLVLARELTIGQLMAFNALMGSVLGPLMGLVGLWSRMGDATVAMERLGDVLDIEPEQKPSDGARGAARPAGRGQARTHVFPLRRRRHAVRAGRHRPRDQARPARGHRRPQRFGQDDAGQAAGGLLSAQRRQDLRGRLRHERHRPRVLPGAGRLRHAEQPAVFRHDRGKHRQRRRQPGPAPRRGRGEDGGCACLHQQAAARLRTGGG
jgi:ATP-binding cassette subfamily B protein